MALIFSFHINCLPRNAMNLPSASVHEFHEFGETLSFNEESSVGELTLRYQRLYHPFTK